MLCLHRLWHIQRDGHRVVSRHILRVRIEVRNIPLLLFNLLLQVTFAGRRHLCRFAEQITACYRQRCEMFRIERFIILVAVGGAYQPEILVTDDDALRRPAHLLHDSLRRKELPGILIGLIETAEARYLHLVQAAEILYFDLEVTDKEVREVEPCQFEEQLVLVQ